MDIEYKEQFLRWERNAHNVMAVRRIYIDLAEDLISGIVLSQIMYWHLPKEDGSSRLMIEKDNHLWIARTHKDWLYECRISIKQVTRALERLKEAELIHTGRYKFKGITQTHIRINWEVFWTKFKALASTLNTPEDIEEHWKNISARDGRSFESYKKEDSECDKKEDSNLTKREITPLPILQKGRLESTKKEDSLTEITTETNSTEKSLIPVGAGIPQISSKEDVIRVLLSLIPEIKETESVPPEKDSALLPIVRKSISILTSGTANWSRESKHISQVIKDIRDGKYSAEHFIYCMVWGYQTGKFDFYAMSACSIPKIMPQFMDLYRTGKLKESLELKPKMENSSQRTERINAERDESKVAQDAERIYAEKSSRLRQKSVRL
jgi:hypothetical protein